jgi:hypothetical protein
MEINRQFNILVVFVAALFLATASWPFPTWAAGGTSTENQVKYGKQKVVHTAKRAVKTGKSTNTRIQLANTAGNVAAVPGAACVPCWSGPVYTWNAPATAGTISQQNTRVAPQQKWPSTTNGAARQGTPQAPQAQPASGGSPGPIWYNVWVPCWNVPATAGPSTGQSHAPIQPPAPPPAAYPTPPPAPLAPPVQAANAGGGVCTPLKWLFSALKPPC